MRKLGCNHASIVAIAAAPDNARVWTSTTLEVRNE